jgi:hypothetical protein
MTVDSEEVKTNNTKIQRPAFKIISSNEDRVFYFPTSKDAQKNLIKEGEEALLLDSINLMGQSIFTLMKTENGQKQWVADFYANEIQQLKERQEIEMKVLEQERELLQ